MRSAVICATYGENPVCSYMIEFGRELMSRGFRVTFVSDGQRSIVESEQGLFPLDHYETWPSVHPTTGRDVAWFARLVRERRASLVVANFGSVTAAIRVAHAMRVPARVAWCRTLNDQISLDAGAPPHRVRSALKRGTYRAASLLIANSQAMRSDLEATYGQEGRRILVAPNAIIDPGMPIAKRREGLVCAARLDTSKGQDVLIRAAAHDPSLPDISFVGTGPRRIALEALARSLGVSDRCRFVGRLPRPELLDLMASSVALVVPSRAEAFGWVAIEAMSVATPVVASDTGGLSEILQYGGGVLSPVGEHIALADAIAHLIRDADRIGQAARRSFELAYDIKIAVPRAVDAVLARHVELA